MAKVIFKQRTLDKDTRVEYPVSDEAVEVSEAFAVRLKASDPNGLRFEFPSLEQKPKAVRPKNTDD